MICLSRKAFPAAPSSPTPSLPSLIHTSVRPPQRSINSFVDLIVQNYIITNQIDVPNPKNPNSHSYHLVYNIQIHPNTCTSWTGHKNRRHKLTGRHIQLRSPTVTTDSIEYSKFSTLKVTLTQMKSWEARKWPRNQWHEKNSSTAEQGKKTSNLRLSGILASVEEMRCCLAKRRFEMQRNPKPELAEEMEEIEERTKQAGCKESDALPWYVPLRSYWKRPYKNTRGIILGSQRVL